MSNPIHPQPEFYLNPKTVSANTINHGIDLATIPRDLIHSPCVQFESYTPADSQQRIVQGTFDYQELAQPEPNMATQTAQIVLLPAPNLGKPEPQQQVQMILPNDVGYQIIPNVSVLVPTTILITDKNECILIPQNSQNLCQTMGDSEQTVATDPRWMEESGMNPATIKVDESSRIGAESAECEYITLANTATQTLVAGLPAEAEVNPTQLIAANNCQILGIIGTNQIGIIHSESNTAENPVLLAINQPESNHHQAENPESNYDINSFLASTISTTTTMNGNNEVAKFDQNQAKQWLKDSFIVNRALKALKKSSSSSSSSNSRHRPHSNWR